MFKLLIATIFLFQAHAFAECEVYGISDSPQKVDCRMGSRNIKLRCQDEAYYLNNTKVEVAFHFEVEEGPVPLVFKAEEKTLTILMHSRKNIKAELNEKNLHQHGTCKLLD